jgi:hypothetical protein
MTLASPSYQDHTVHTTKQDLARRSPTHTHHRLRTHVLATSGATTDRSIKHDGLPEKMAYPLAQKQSQS